MRIEIIIIIITGLLMFNLYTEGKYLNMVFKWKKYYQMAGIAVGGIFIYYLIKKNPLSAGHMLTTTNEYLKYMPIDKNTSNLLSPILDFTSKQNFYQDQYSNNQTPVLPVQDMNMSQYEKKIMTSGLSAGGTSVGGTSVGGQKVKRSVSETKKNS